MKKILIVSVLVFALLPLGAVYHKIGDFTTPLDVQSLVVENGIAYLAEGSSDGSGHYAILQMLDVSDPQTPFPLGSLNLPLGVYDSYYGLHVDVENGVAYIILDLAIYSLKIVDVSDPQNPVFVSNLWGSATNVCVEDSLAYVAAYFNGLKIYNISDPQNTVLLGSVDTPALFSCVTVVGNIAYVGEQGEPYLGLRIFDVSNPSVPTLMGSCSGPLNPWNIAISGTLAIVPDTVNGLFIIDINDPEFPIQIGWIDLGWQDLYSVTVTDNIAYVANDSDGMKAIDFSDPQNPFQISAFAAPGNTYDVKVIGNIAYLAGSDGLQCVDISQPQNPALVASVDTLDISSFTFADDMAYVADGGLKIIDVSDPQHPVILGSCNTPEVAHHIAVKNDIAYTSGSWFFPLWGTGNCELDLIDISDPQSPAIIDSCYIGNGEIPAGCVAVQGGTAFVANGANLKVIDVSNPQNTFIAGNYPTTGDIRSIAIGDSVAYVSTSAGLQILDITIPQNPSLLCSYAFPADYVSLSGDLACVALGSSGVHILDVSDPATPVLVGSIPTHYTTSYINRCLIRDNMLYISDNDWNEISIYDISTPQTPVLLDRYAWNLSSSDMWVDGNLLYTANGSHGLNIHDLTAVDVDDPAQIPPSAFQMRNYPNPFNPETTISYTLPSAGLVTLQIYNSRGQMIRSLIQEEHPAGEHALIWNGKDNFGNSVASGLYLCRIACNGTYETKKMLLLK
jgi:hypothetical protein